MASRITAAADVADVKDVGSMTASSHDEVVPTGLATERLASLDAFRGFIMFWIIGGEGLAEGLNALGHGRALQGVLYELRHTPWQGLRFYDCIWPCFMLMTGASVALSFTKRSRTQAQWPMTVHAVQRLVVLFLLGSLRESVHRGTPYWVELSSALQPIAVASFVAFLLVRKSARVQAAVAAGILAVYTLVLALVPAPGVPAGSYEPELNLVRYVDLAVLGRTYPGEPWGTVLCTLPTVSTTILGLILGGWLLSARSKQLKLKMMGGAGLACLALGYALSPVVPVIMKIWTSTYGLLTAGWACLIFTIFYWIVDVRGFKRWTFPFVVIGSNAIFIYMATSIVPIGEWARIFTHVWAGGASVEHLLHAVVVLTAEWLILHWMYQRKVFIKA